MEQELYKAFWWWAVGLVLGMSLRILWGAIQGQVRTYADLDDYIKNNAIVLTFVAVSYSAIVILWRATNLVSFVPFVDKIDIYPGVVNAWSIVICFVADVLFSFVIRKYSDKIKAQGPSA